MIEDIFSSGDLYVDLAGLFMASLSTGIILGIFAICFIMIFRRRRSRSRLYD